MVLSTYQTLNIKCIGIKTHEGDVVTSHKIGTNHNICFLFVLNDQVLASTNIVMYTVNNYRSQGVCQGLSNNYLLSYSLLITVLLTHIYFIYCT